MHDKSIPEDLTRGDRDFGEMERSVLYLLTDPERHPTIWSVPDIGREIEYFDPEALIWPLRNAGLVHRVGEFVFATPAAFHLIGLTGHVD
ncbi:MAG: hypothetical protein ACLP1Q_18730 [Solirubrobacteraceae bacterium]